MNLRLLQSAILALIFSNSLLLHAAAASDTGRKSAQPQSTVNREEARTSGDALLQADDVLRVQVFQEEDINKSGEVRVSKDSTITLPLIGVVSLAGKTAHKAEEMISGLYDKD
jgi:protein involved in polysaccharide export with SLBB domain